MELNNRSIKEIGNELILNLNGASDNKSKGIVFKDFINSLIAYSPLLTKLEIEDNIKYNYYNWDLLTITEPKNLAEYLEVMSYEDTVYIYDVIHQLFRLANGYNLMFKAYTNSIYKLGCFESMINTYIDIEIMNDTIRENIELEANELYANCNQLKKMGLISDDFYNDVISPLLENSLNELDDIKELSSFNNKILNDIHNFKPELIKEIETHLINSRILE